MPVFNQFSRSINAGTKGIGLWFSILCTLLVSTSVLADSKYRLLADQSYAADPLQKLDIYLPKTEVKSAPVIFMVHGGAWRVGDKSSRAVVKNKVDYWIQKGFIFISVNYRLLPETDPITQQKDVAKALAFAQGKAPLWGGSADKFILMGHSAGAHLVSLLSVNAQKQKSNNIKPWLATVALDSAAFDVIDIMQSNRVARFYREAFGTNETYWEQASPYHQLEDDIPPFLAVCSSQRKDGACDQAERFVRKIQRTNGVAKVLPVDLSHRQVNAELGKINAYTAEVDRFIKQALK
ncbi:MAG: alpha/beta hydrolase [Neptuniibacter sp.]